MRYIGTINNGKFFDFSFEGSDRSKIQPVVDDFFVKMGYKNLGVIQNKSTYEKGSRNMRLLLGAFVSYHKLDTIYIPDSENTKIRLLNASSGMSGGLIGMNQVKKEFTRIVAQLNDHLEKAHFS